MFRRGERAAGSFYRVIAGCAAALAIAKANAAGAQPPAPQAGAPGAVSVRYQAPLGCPDRIDFLDRVRSRLTRGTLAAVEEGTAFYQVRLERKEGGIVAELEPPDPREEGRRIEAESCDQAASAIALVTALAIEARVDAPPEPPSVSPRPAAEPVDPHRSGPTLRWQLGLRGVVSTPKAPRVLPGLELFGGMADSAGGWTVSVALAGDRSRRIDRRDGQVRFSFVGARFNGCIGSAALATTLRLYPCGHVEAGRLIAEGFADVSRTAGDPWVAVGASARLAWQLGPVDVVADGGVLFPLTSRDRFVFGEVSEPQSLVHDVPGIGAFGAAGIALPFE